MAVAYNTRDEELLEYISIIEVSLISKISKNKVETLDEEYALLLLAISQWVEVTQFYDFMSGSLLVESEQNEQIRDEMGKVSILEAVPAIIAL